MVQELFSLALQGTLRKKRSSILIVLVLLLSFSFAIVALSLVESISKTNAEFRLSVYGRWFYAIPSGVEADAQWLQEQDWIERFGTAQSCGSISTSDGRFGFGTLDAAMLDVGDLRVEQGHFPSADNEIAMEAALLNALGYDYTLGQEITLSVQVPYGDSTVTVQQTYQLCGVIHGYSQLWYLTANPDNQLLVSAAVTDAAAEQLLEQARSQVQTPEEQQAIAAVPQYFLVVPEKERDTELKKSEKYELLAKWLTSYDRNGGLVPRRINPSQNVIAYNGESGEEADSFYIVVIAAVTLAAVLCVYLMRLPDELHSFAVLRSVGITKPQLAVLVLEETLLLCVPAVLLGTLCGAGCIRLILKLLVYAGSVPIRVSIPYRALIPVLLLWVAVVLATRLLIFAVAVRTPLTGRLQMRAVGVRRVKRVRDGMILLLLSAFSVVVIFARMESIWPEYMYKYYSIFPSYEVSRSSQESQLMRQQGIPKEEISLLPDPILPAEIEQLGQIPGATQADGYSEMTVGLSYPGLDEITTTLYALEDEEAWDATLDFGADKEAFRNGEQMMLYFPEKVRGEEQVFDEVGYSLPAGEAVLCAYDADGNRLFETTIKVKVQVLPENVLERGYYRFDKPYTLACSEAYLKQLLALLPEGAQWGVYTGGGAFGYERILINIDPQIGSSSTDLTMREFSNRCQLVIANFRQETTDYRQERLQILILLGASCGCIALVVLLILAGALTLEAEQEKRSFRTLRAIGMSARQMWGRVFGKAAGRALLAIVSGWILYLAYAVYDEVHTNAVGIPGVREPQNISPAQALRRIVNAWKYYDFGAEKVVLLLAACFAILLIVSLLAKRRLGKGDIKL